MTVSEAPQEWQMAECLLPGLTLVSAAKLTARITAEATGQSPPGVFFLGSLLMPGDEVLLCLFAGPEAEVRALGERAGLPFERILPCAGLGWLARAWPPERKERRCNSTASRVGGQAGSRPG